MHDLIIWPLITERLLQFEVTLYYTDHVTVNIINHNHFNYININKRNYKLLVITHC